MVIPLKGLSFDLLVALVRAAPGLLSFDQLSERVWPGLVVTPETIVQRVKLLRDALGDEPQAARYIEGVRGHGYRLVAAVRPLTGSPSTTAPTAPARSISLRWIGGALALGVLVAASWELVQRWGPGSGTAPPSIRSLAVLPLENLSGDKEQEYFTDGMTDALTTDLAQIASLRVISRTSAMHFKGSRETLPQISRELNVDAVVEGTVTRGENRVRVTAQLIEARGDHHLWARSYERDLKDVLALQDEIGRDITEQIRVKVNPKERSVDLQVHAVDPEALDDYLRGRYWAHTESSEGAQKALEYYRKVIAKDSNYAPAYAGIADAFLVMANWDTLPAGPTAGPIPLNDAAPRIKEAATKALALDPSLAEPHASLGFIQLFNDWNFSGAEADLKQAIVLNPNLALAHLWYGYYLEIADRIDEAVKECERARDLDPFDFFVNEQLAQALYHARRYDDALRQMQRTLEMFPDRGRSLYHDIADVYEQKKMFAEAFAARQQELDTFKCPCAAPLAEAYKRGGYRGWMLKAIHILEKESPDPDDFLPWRGHFYALLGDEGHAMSCFERAYEQHNVSVLFVRTSPELDLVRSSARYRDLVRRIGFPQQSGDRN